MTTLPVTHVIRHAALERAVQLWQRPSGDERTAWSGDDAAAALREAVLPALARSGMARVRLLEDSGETPPEAFADLLAMLSRQIGFLLPQTHNNNLVAFIRDEGEDYRSPSTRGHQTNADLAFHSDRCDINALLYLRQAATGGLLSVVSYEDAVGALARTDQRALRVLFGQIPFDLREQRIFEEPRWHCRPVLWETGNGVRGHYIRRFITDSQRHQDCPRLTDEQLAALDAWDRVLSGLRAQCTFAPERGELLLLDNYRVMHARTEFHDDPNARGRGRLALRTWIAPFHSDALPESLLPLSGAVGPGCFRGGVGRGEQYLRCLGTHTAWSPEKSL